MPSAGRPTPSLGRVVGAFVRRDLLSASSYRIAFVLRTIGLLFALASLAYLARFVDSGGAVLGGRYGNAGYFGFFLLGVAAAELFQAMTWAFSTPIREAQLAGTLEAMLSTPAPASHVLVGAASGGILFAFARLTVYVVVGMLAFDVRFGPTNYLSVVIIIVLALVAFLSLGLLGGALTMRLRRSDPVSSLVGMATVLIGGILYPVDLLPAPLEVIAYLIPLGPALEGLRRGLFAGAAPADLWRELLALGGFVAVVAPFSVWLFAYSLRRAREDGSLAFY